MSGLMHQISIVSIGATHSLAVLAAGAQPIDRARGQQQLVSFVSTSR